MIIVNTTEGPNTVCKKCEGHGEVVYDSFNKTYQIFCGVHGHKADKLNSRGCDFKTPPRKEVFECAEDWANGYDLFDAIDDGFYDEPNETN